jgi:UDP-glucose 4-epimerase
MTPQRIAVTGAAGLIGSNIVKKLVAQKIRVVAVDNFTIGEWREENDLIAWVKADVTAPSVAEAFDEHRPDAVIHCAAHPGGKSLKEPVLDVSVNALGSMRVFDWCARNSAAVVYLSSSAVYGEQPKGPILETAPVAPGTIYAACKIACENYLRILGDGYGLPWTVLRVFATYGAGHKPSAFQGILNIMLTQLIAGNKVIVKGALSRERDMVYAEDTAQATVRAALTEKARGKIINVGTGRAVTVREMIGHLGKALGKDMSKVEIVEEAGTVGDPRYSVADTTRARDILDFSAEYTIQQGIEKLIHVRNLSSR